MCKILRQANAMISYQCPFCGSFYDFEPLWPWVLTLLWRNFSYDLCGKFSVMYLFQVNVNKAILSWWLQNNEFVTCIHCGGHLAMTLTIYNLDIWLNYYILLFCNIPLSNKFNTKQFDSKPAMFYGCFQGDPIFSQFFGGHLGNDVIF